MSNPWTKKISIKRFLEENQLPEMPGVYFFLGPKDEILYIGKATILSDRVKSYFGDDLAETRGPKLVLMRERARSIAWRPLDSVLEALLLEGQLIKKYQPIYNTDAKDDKSYNFLAITDEAFPRVLVVREKDILSGKMQFKIKEQFGPYPRGGALLTALKIVRQIFPYRDKCVPFEELTSEAKLRAKPCFHAQLGLCPGVCTGAITNTAYRRHVKRISLFFSGKKADLVKRLEREMHGAAKALKFEQAGEIKKLLFDLGHIRDVALMKLDREESSAARIEAYDTAHLQGSSTVGVMTVVQHAIPKKSEYRLFKLRGEHGGNDLSALEEILTRRLAHQEWTLPELMVVDGALLQSAVALRVLKKHQLTIPIVGVVKDEKHQPKKVIGPQSLVKRFEKDILLANAEAHRFAISFHRKKKRESFLGG
ncbi:MAG: hypothetical protein E6P95_01130 [Candidatus Moraniibacteriota bacterium]|nr:MAG: hypothetical protein E6P95_01130 [Candidatus Moranbacteria bacterium]